MPDKDEKRDEETGVADEINAMLSGIGDPRAAKPSDEDEEEKEEEKEPEKKPDEKEEEKEEEEEKEPEKKAEKKADEKESDEEEEEEDKDAIIARLRERLNAEPEKKEPVKKEEVKKEEPKEEPLTLEEQDFIGELDLDDLVRDKTALNKILNSVYTKGVADSKKIATEGVLRSLPDIVKHNLTLITALKESSDKFYADNKDLVPFKRVVASVFEEIAAKNPDKRYDELMKDVAPEVRKRLELHKNAVKGEDKEEKKLPRLPGKKNNQRQKAEKPDTSSLQDEIAEMNKTIGR